MSLPGRTATGKSLCYPLGKRLSGPQTGLDTVGQWDVKFLALVVQHSDYTDRAIEVMRYSEM
jgi:hypothetical protein